MDMTAFQKEQPTLLDKCDEQMVRQLIEKITEHDKGFDRHLALLQGHLQITETRNQGLTQLLTKFS